MARSRTIALAAVVAVFTSGLGSEARASPAGKCHVKGAHVVARVGPVVVLGRRSDKYVGCLTATGERRRLPVGDDVDLPQGFRVNGTVLEYEMNPGCFAACWAVVVVDMKSGRTSVSYRGYGSLRRVVVDPLGRVGWVRDGRVREVHVMDSAGEETVDSGPSIDPGSLRIAAGRLRWLASGSQHSVQLDARRPCGRHNSSTLARSDEARLFWIHEKVYGCDTASGRTTFMGDSSVNDFEYYGGGAVHVAGHFATIDRGYAGRGGADAAFYVFDLSRGAVAHRWDCCAYPLDGRLDDAVVTNTGAAAWLASIFDSRTGHLEVRKSDADGEAILLDSGARDAIDETSFRLDGFTVSWLHDGQRRTAELR